MKDQNKLKNKKMGKLLTAFLLCALVLALLAGCEKKEKYYPADDYMKLESSKLDYADESDARDFSVSGWKSMSSSSKKTITDFGSVVGYWKAVMISDPEGESDEGMFTDYFNVEISGSASETSVIFNWHRRIMSNTGEELELTSIRGGHEGSFSNGSISASGYNSISLTSFWSDGGKQYAYGKYTWSDGIEGYIGLVRTSKK